jgi:hypothetical protein
MCATVHEWIHAIYARELSPTSRGEAKIERWWSGLLAWTTTVRRGGDGHLGGGLNKMHPMVVGMALPVRTTRARGQHQCGQPMGARAHRWANRSGGTAPKVAPHNMRGAGGQQALNGAAL